MRRLAWIVTLPLTLVVVVFAVANRNKFVALDLFPFDVADYPVPLLLVVLACLLFGFLCGIVVMWLSAGKSRRRARESHYRASNLEREVAYLKRKQHEAAEQAATKAPGTGSGGSGASVGVPAAQLPAASARR